MRQSKTRKNFFKPRYNLILKTKSVLWSNIFKMRKVIKKRKWRSVFFDFRPLKVLRPNLRQQELKQLQKTTLLYNPFSIFIKNQFKFNFLNNFNFLQNKTRLNYLNMFLKISNILFENFGNILNITKTSKSVNLVQVLYNILYNLGSKKLELPIVLKKINFFFNFLKKNLNVLSSQKNFFKKFNFKKYAILRKTNNFRFFVNYRDYIENEVINSIFFKRGQFRTTKILENDVLQNKMSSIFINSYAIKLTKKKVIRNFFAINTVKKFKRMLSKSIRKGKRFNLQRKLSQCLLLKLNTVIHTLGWSESILNSKSLLKNREIFLNDKIINYANHVLKIGDLIKFKKSSLHMKHINIDPRVRKLASMKKGTRLYTKLFEGLLERFKNGYKPTGTSIWYIFRRKRAIKRKFTSRRLKRPLNQSRARSKSFTAKNKNEQKKRVYFRRNMFFDRKSREMLSKLYLFRKKFKRKRRLKKFTEYHRRRREFLIKARHWPLFAEENRRDLLKMSSNLKLDYRSKRFFYNFRELKIRKFLTKSGKIDKQNPLVSNFQSKYRYFLSKYPRIFLKYNSHQKLNQRFFVKSIQNPLTQKKKKQLQQNMHLLVPFSFLEHSSMKLIYPTAFQMKRRKLIFTRFEKKIQKKYRPPFRMRYGDLLKHVVRPILSFENQTVIKPLVSRNVFIKNKKLQTTQFDNLFFKKHRSMGQNYNNTQNMLLNLFWYNKQKYHQNNLIKFKKPFKVHNSFLIKNHDTLRKTLLSGHFSSFYLNNFYSNTGLLNYLKALTYKNINQKIQNTKNSFIKLAVFRQSTRKFFKKIRISSIESRRNEKHFQKSLEVNPSLEKHLKGHVPVFLQNSRKNIKNLTKRLLNKNDIKCFYNPANLEKLTNSALHNQLLKIETNILLNHQNILLRKLINSLLLRKRKKKKHMIISRKIMWYQPRPIKYRKHIKWRSSEYTQSLFKNFRLSASYLDAKKKSNNLQKLKMEYDKFSFLNFQNFTKSSFFFFTTPSLRTKLYKTEAFKIYKTVLDNTKKMTLQHRSKKKYIKTSTLNHNLINQSFNMLLQNDSKLNLIYRLMDNNLALFSKSSGILPAQSKSSFINTSTKGLLKKLMSRKIKAPFLEYKRFMAIIVDLPNPSKDFVKRNSLYLNNTNLYRLLK